MKKLLSSFMALLMLVGVVSCGGATKKAAQGISEKEVKVANCATSSGAYAAVGIPYLAGMRAYFDMINTEGGINGRTINFINQDDEFDPVKGKACLEKMLNDEKVFSIVGHFGTPVVGATLETLKEVGIPSVYFATGIGKLYNEKAEGNDRAIFPVQPTYPMEGRIMIARLFGDFKAKKIGIIYTNDDAGKDLFNGATKEAKERNVELVSEQVTVGSADVSAAVTKIKQAGVDSVIVAAIQATFPTVVKEMAAQSMNVPVITTYVNVNKSLADAVAKDIKGKFDVYGSGWVDLSAKTEMELYGKWVVKQPNGSTYATNAYAMTGWIAAYTFSEGLRNMKKTDNSWSGYIDALESKPIKNPFGGTIDYSKGKRLGTQEMNLSKIDVNTSTWVAEFPLASIDSIIKNKK